MVINNEIIQGVDRATLTLSDGSVVVLEDKQNGLLASQGAVQV